MKKFRLFFFGIAFSLFVICLSCGNNPAKVDKKDSTKKVAANFTYDGSTPINRIDEKGLRQGWWIIFGKTKKDPEFVADAKFGEGRYVDSKEEGEWIFYNPNGTVKMKINYKSGIEVK